MEINFEATNPIKLQRAKDQCGPNATSDEVKEAYMKMGGGISGEIAVEVLVEEPTVEKKVVKKVNKSVKKKK